MKVSLPFIALAVASCDQGQADHSQPKAISCAFKNAGSMIVDADVRSSFPVPPEVRDPVSFEVEGQITGGRFAGKLMNFRNFKSDLIYQEDVLGSFDPAGGSVSFTTKASFRFAIWTHGDLPDQQGSRAMFLGNLNGLENASLFVGACGIDR